MSNLGRNTAQGSDKATKDTKATSERDDHGSKDSASGTC